MHQRADVIGRLTLECHGLLDREKRRELLDVEGAVALLGRRVDVHRKLGLGHPPQRFDRPEPVRVQRDDPRDPLPVGLDGLRRGRAAAVLHDRLLPGRKREQRREPPEVVDVREVADRRILGPRHAELLQRAAAEEERVVQRPVGIREPVRLHHLARLTVDALEDVCDGEQLERQQAPLLQLDGEHRREARRSERRDAVVHRHDRKRLQRERPPTPERSQLERVPDPGARPGARRKRPTDAGFVQFTTSEPSR